MDLLLKILENAAAIQIVGVAIVTMIVVWGVKSTEILEKRFLPVFSIFIGIVCGFFLSFYFGNPGQSIIYGVISGAMASGFYDVLMSFIHHVGKEEINHEELDEEFTTRRNEHE